MMQPIAEFLPVFVPGGAGPSLMTMPEEAFALEPVDDVPVGVVSEEEAERRVAEARAEILAEAAAALEAALAEQAAELQVRHAEEMARQRLHWSEAQAAALDDALRRGFDELEAKLADSLVHVLEPFVDEAIRATAAAELKGAVSDLLINGAGATVRVSGPADLVDPLRTAFADQAALQFETADSPDVTVETDDTTIRSQLGPWADRLKATTIEAGR